MERSVQYIKVAMICLLLIGIMEVPLEAFSMIKLIAMGAFLWIAYYEYLYYRELRMIIFGALSILYQPFIDFGITREYWIIINLLSALWVAYSLYLDKNKPREKKISGKKKKHKK
ncbi:MAG: DUF6804 family protein [Bacteroidales bacterium]